MPELPDVEEFRKHIEANALGKKIRRTRVLDDKVLKNIDASAFAKTLEGRSFEQVVRHGKFCFVVMDNHKNLAMHFGMTGFIRYYNVHDKAPEYVCIAFDFDNDYTLSYDSRRKLGRVELVENLDRFIEERGLGPDALDPDFSENDFQKATGGRRGSLKAALMKQEIIAGIGNVYSDEILFQERLHPATAITDLDEVRLGGVFRTMRRILSQVIETGNERRGLPESLLTPHRGRDMQCPSCKGRLEKIKAAGRSAYFCPSCQAR